MIRPNLLDQVRYNLDSLDRPTHEYLRRTTDSDDYSWNDSSSYDPDYDYDDPEDFDDDMSWINGTY